MERKTRVTSAGEPVWAANLHRRSAAMGVPLAGNFELTSRCNFRCRMCYVHEEQHPDALTAEEWIRLGEEARDAGMFFLLLTGGEPLVRKDFRRIYEALSEMGLLLSLNTNGSLIDDELYEFFVKHPPLRMNISLYGGTEEAYERLCGVRACETVKNNIRRLRKAGIAVKINASITPYNAEEIEAVYAFGREVESPVAATAYMFPPVRVNGCRYGEAPARFEAEEAAERTLFCREQMYTAERLERIAAGIEPDEELCCGEEGENMRCRAGKSAFWVTWDGRMLPCGMFPMEGFSLKEYGFRRAWEEVRQLTRTVMMPKECTCCPKKNRCAVCAAACFAETGSSEVRPDYICRMTREYDRLLCDKYKKTENDL